MPEQNNSLLETAVIKKFQLPQEKITIEGIKQQSKKGELRQETLEALKEIRKRANQTLSNPEKILENRVDRIKSLFDRGDSVEEKERDVKVFKRWAFDKFVIKPSQIPESVYELEQRIAINRGHGQIAITPEYKETKNAEIIDGQKASLENWIDYLAGPDAFYDDSFKYLVARCITKMGKLDKAKWQYEKRSSSTTSSFPEINSEALGIVERLIKSGEKMDGDELFNTEEFVKLSKTANFEKLYPLVQKQLNEIQASNVENKENIKGSWTKFDQGSDYKLLENSLKNKGTGWCTASGSAKSQLEGGDFYVFYSQDKDGNDTQPRVAIRMSGNQIGEIRGVQPGQELEPELNQVMNEKAKDLGGYEKYQKKSADMKQLTEISSKNEKGEELNKEELRFLYEINNNIEGFGYNKDPRIAEVKNFRSQPSDLMCIFECRRDQLILSDEDYASENVAYILPALKESIASSERTRLSTLEVLAKDEDPKIRGEVAKNSNLQIELENLLINDISVNVRSNLAKNQNISQEAMNKLSKSTHPLIRASLAQNPNLPLEILEKFVDDSYDVRREIAKRVDLPRGIVEKLFNDKNEDVLSRISNNKLATESLLIKRIDSPSVVLALVNRPDISVEAINKIYQSKRNYQFLALANNLPLEIQRELLKIGEGNSENILDDLAKNQNVAPEILMKLSANKGHFVRKNIARNSNVSSETLSKLAYDSEESVRQDVAMNTSTPPKILDVLAKDNNYYTKINVLNNPNAPLLTIFKLLEDKAMHKYDVESVINLRKEQIGKGIMQTKLKTLKGNLVVTNK